MTTPVMADLKVAQQPEISQAELRRNLFQMIWPVTTESVLQMMVGIVGSAMVGRLGAEAIGSVGLSSRVTQISWALFFGISTGATILVARSLGSKDMASARKTAEQSLISSVLIVSLLTLISFVFARPFLSLLNAGPELLDYSMQYLGIALWGLPFVAIMQTIGGILRGAGNTKTPMQIAFIINIVNIIANWLFIFGNLGFPTMGIRGAALGAVIAQSCGAVLALRALLGPRSPIEINIKNHLKIDFSEIKKLLRIGIPSSAESLFWQLATIILMSLIVTFGPVPLAAHQQGLQAESLSYMPAAGFGIAATAFVGQSLGAKNIGLAQRYIRELTYWSMYLTIVTSSILFFIPSLVMSILTNDPAVIAEGAKYLMLMAVASFPQQLSGVLNGALRGAGDTAAPMIVSGIGMWLIRIPLSYLLGSYLGFGIVGVWVAMTIDLFVRFGLSYVRYRQGRWKHMQF